MNVNREPSGIPLGSEVVVFGGDFRQIPPMIFIYMEIRQTMSTSVKSILCPKNETVDLINNHVIHLLSGEGTTLLSGDPVEGITAVIFPTEFLNSITSNGMAPYRLLLKKFVTVILLRNLDPDEGLCNGTRLIIRAFF